LKACLLQRLFGRCGKTGAFDRVRLPSDFAGEFINMITQCSKGDSVYIQKSDGRDKKNLEKSVNRPTIPSTSAMLTLMVVI
jgi:hypothetical protein